MMVLNKQLRFVMSNSERLHELLQHDEQGVL